MNQEIKNELDKIARGFPERMVHKAPEGYFDSLPDKVLKQWDEQHTSQTTTPVIQLRKMISAAAMVTGICFAIALFSHPETNPAVAGQVTAEDAYAYISYYIEEFEPLLEVPLSEADYDDFQMITTDGLEEYLLEEFSGSELDQIF